MNSIFVIALGAVILAMALASPLELNEEQKAKLKQFSEQCSKELNLTEDEIAKVKAKELKTPTEYVKCFNNCVFEKFGALKNGVLQRDVVLAKLSVLIGEKKTKATLDKCGSIKGEDECYTADKLHECFEDELKS